MALIFDIETDGLLGTLTKIHSLVICDTKDGAILSCTDNDKNFNSIEEGLKFLQEADEIVGHNIVKFDIPAIQKIHPNFKPKGKIFDTLLMSKLVYPDIGEMDDKNIRKGKFPKRLRGKYSLEAWGYRLNELKGDYGKQDGAWDKWAPDMQRYCEQDVMVTKKLYTLLKSKGIPEETIKLEHQFAHIISLQEQRGVYFDKEKAVALAAHLTQEKTRLETELKCAFPDEIKESVFIPKANNSKRGYIKGQPFIKRSVVKFNPSSTQQIAKRLIQKYGWKPKVFTDTGQPKITDEIMESLPYKEAPLIAQYLMINKRISELVYSKTGGSYLQNLDKDNVIRGKVDTIGCVTGRCSHSGPNLANVTAIDKPYGIEMRSLFIARPGYKLVGCDASGLELRDLAHYMNDKEYTNEILNGDIHTKNQMAAGLPTRNNAKTFIYGFLYGAGDAKIGSITGKGAKEGKAIKKKFLASLPNLRRLSEGVKSKIKARGYLKGIDGRKLRVRESYKGLNVLLQSAGAIVMKKALCILYEDCLGQGWKYGEDFAFVLNVHDEYQAEIKPEIVEEYKVLAVNAIKKAGDYFGFRCPLDGEAKVGNSWYDTH